MIAFLLRRLRDRFAPEPPDVAEIEQRYAEHDQKLAKVDGTARQVRRWRMRLESGEPSGNVIADLARGTYLPRREPESRT